MPRLRRSDLTRPGITRRHVGPGSQDWEYDGPDGRVLTDPATVERCRALVLPPAWSDVWISPWPNGHVQAVGTDVKGRRQYRYHEAWTAQQAERKFDHVLEVATALWRIRAGVQADLALPGMPRERALACAVRLLEVGFFRIGSEEYTEANGSFGLATLRKDHVELETEAVLFDYIAKSGKQRHRTIPDPAVRACVQELLARDDEANPELLAWYDEAADRWVDVKSADINDHLRLLVGRDVSAKDFRTWAATMLCAVALAVSTGVADSPTARRRAITRAVAETAHHLGNTPAVCRASYIHPRLFDLYADGITVVDALDAVGDTAAPGDLAYHGAVEAAVLGMLREEPAAASRRQTKARARAGGQPPQVAAA